MCGNLNEYILDLTPSSTSTRVVPAPVKRFKRWLACLRNPKFWTIASRVSSLSVSALRGAVELITLARGPGGTYMDMVLKAGQADLAELEPKVKSGLALLRRVFVQPGRERAPDLDALITAVKTDSDAGLLSAMANLLDTLPARDDETSVAVAVNGKGANVVTYHDKWSAKLLALRCILLKPFMVASSRVVGGVLESVAALHDRGWLREGYDRALYARLRGDLGASAPALRLQPEPPAPGRALYSLFQPLQPEVTLPCGRVESLCGVDVSSLLVLQLSGVEVYSDSVVGRPLLCCVHESVLQGSETQQAQTRAAVVEWLTFVMRSPLCSYLKRCIVKLLQCPGMALDPLEAVLSSKATSRANPPPDLRPAARLKPRDQLCAFYALAQRCPLASTKTTMLSLVSPHMKPTLEDLLTRKGFIYGVRVVPGLYGIQSLLGKLGVTCVEVDLEAVYQTKSETDDIVYSRIRGLQQQFQACFVYIKGLLTVSDGTQQAPHLLLSVSCPDCIGSMLSMGLCAVVLFPCVCVCLCSPVQVDRRVHATDPVVLRPV
jgi:hypothetical protein